jgi:hypothetical protein
MHRMVHDFNKRPEQNGPNDWGHQNDGWGNQSDGWGHQNDWSQQSDDWGNQREGYYSSYSESQQIAQAVPAVPAALIAPVAPVAPVIPGPAFPWVNRSDWKIFNDLFTQNKNPLTGQDFQKPEEKKAILNLTQDQVKGVKKSEFQNQLQNATHSFRSNACTFVDLDIPNGTEAHTMMVDALTGRHEPSLVVTPSGHTAMFDSQYRGNSRRHPKNQLFEVESITPPMTPAQMGVAQSYIKMKLAEWERQAAIAGQCGLTLRVALPDAELVQWARQHLNIQSPNLQITEGKWGGTYGQVRADTVGGEVHHMPADSATDISKAKGPAIWMYGHHHAKTKSNGGVVGSRSYRDRQKDLINQGKLDQAMIEDIQNVMNIAPGLYNVPIQQMLKTRRKNDQNAKTNK